MRLAPSRRLLLSITENKAGGIGAYKRIIHQLRRPPSASTAHAAFFNWRQGGGYVGYGRETDCQARTKNWRADGVTVVEWNGQVFTRRSASNKFPEAIWYSRHLGQDVDGNRRYVRLITFKVLSDAEPVAAKAKKAIRT